MLSDIAFGFLRVISDSLTLFCGAGWLRSNSFGFSVRCNDHICHCSNLLYILQWRRKWDSNPRGGMITALMVFKTILLKHLSIPPNRSLFSNRIARQKDKRIHILSFYILHPSDSFSCVFYPTVLLTAFPFLQTIAIAINICSGNDLFCRHNRT